MATLRSNEPFSAVQIGMALAKFWTLEEFPLRLVPVDDCPKCPITLETISNAGMTLDGHTYQMGYIMEWLAKHSTSPMTNMPLRNKMVLRLTSVHDLVQEFLKRCRRNCASDDCGVASCKTLSTKELRLKFEYMEMGLQHRRHQLEELSTHVDRLAHVVGALHEELKNREVLLLQAVVRLLLAKKRSRKHVAAQQVQKVWRGRVARRHAQSAKRNQAALQLQAVARSWLAQTSMRERQHPLDAQCVEAVTRSNAGCQLLLAFLKGCQLEQGETAVLGEGASLWSLAQLRVVCRTTHGFVEGFGGTSMILSAKFRLSRFFIWQHIAGTGVGWITAVHFIAAVFACWMAKGALRGFVGPGSLCVLCCPLVQWPQPKYEVTLDRRRLRCPPLGLRFGVVGFIFDVEAHGLASQWNRRNPDNPIAVGDCIERVNGVSGCTLDIQA